MSGEDKTTQREITTVESARAIWALYRQHGLGKFANWLTLKPDDIPRKKVVQALRFPEIQRSAKKAVEYYRFKIDEIEQMIKEAEAVERE